MSLSGKALRRAKKAEKQRLQANPNASAIAAAPHTDPFLELPATVARSVSKALVRALTVAQVLPLVLPPPVVPVVLAVHLARRWLPPLVLGADTEGYDTHPASDSDDEAAGGPDCQEGGEEEDDSVVRGQQLRSLGVEDPSTLWGVDRLLPLTDLLYAGAAPLLVHPAARTLLDNVTALDLAGSGLVTAQQLLGVVSTDAAAQPSRKKRLKSKAAVEVPIEAKDVVTLPHVTSLDVTECSALRADAFLPLLPRRFPSLSHLAMTQIGAADAAAFGAMMTLPALTSLRIEHFTPHALRALAAREAIIAAARSAGRGVDRVKAARMAAELFAGRHAAGDDSAAADPPSALDALRAAAPMQRLHLGRRRQDSGTTVASVRLCLAQCRGLESVVVAHPFACHADNTVGGWKQQGTIDDFQHCLAEQPPDILSERLKLDTDETSVVGLGKLTSMRLFGPWLPAVVSAVADDSAPPGSEPRGCGRLTPSPVCVPYAATLRSLALHHDIEVGIASAILGALPRLAVLDAFHSSGTLAAAVRVHAQGGLPELAELSIGTQPSYVRARPPWVSDLQRLGRQLQRLSLIGDRWDGLELAALLRTTTAKALALSVRAEGLHPSVLALLTSRVEAGALRHVFIQWHEPRRNGVGPWNPPIAQEEVERQLRSVLCFDMREAGFSEFSMTRV